MPVISDGLAGLVLIANEDDDEPEAVDLESSGMLNVAARPESASAASRGEKACGGAPV